MVLGATGGGLLGSLYDLDNLGVGLDFLDLVANKMEAGTVAVVSEVDEYWTAPLDTRMEALGGEVYRRSRTDFEDEQFAQEVQAWNDELDALDAEMQEASDEMKAKLEARKAAIRQNLEDAMAKGDKKVAQLESELDAKVASLEKQAADAKADAKAKIDANISKVRAGYSARMAKLKEAGNLIREALS
jgi:DNA repair exonuclease SbcCD ATPase subunit